LPQHAGIMRVDGAGLQMALVIRVAFLQTGENTPRKIKLARAIRTRR
jgi:hypothetical protein